MLIKPDAVANAATITSLLEPTRSAIGAITGIVAAAKPDDDGTISYSKNYKNAAEKIKEAFLKDLDNCSDEDFAKIDQMTEYADHALDVAYVNYGSYESFIKSEPDAVCVIAIATGDVNSYYDGIRNMDSYNGNTAARTQVVYTVPKSFKNTIKALQELGILNSKLYMDKDYLPGDSTSYKEYTGEYYYDDYTSSSDLYDYTDDSYIDGQRILIQALHYRKAGF